MRRFMAQHPDYPHKLRAEWLLAVDDNDFCTQCQGKHPYIAMNGEDGFCQHPSVFDCTAICIVEARKYDDWEVETTATPRLEDWNRWSDGN